MDKRPIMNKWYTRWISVALVLVVLCQMGWPGKIMVADAEESGTTVVTSGDVTPGDAGYAEKSLAEQYLEEIAALKAEALLIDGTSADVTLMCADVYERLMGVYAEAVDAYDAGKITDDEYGEIETATGDVVKYLEEELGYSPYAMLAADSSGIQGNLGTADHIEIEVNANVKVNVDGKNYTTTVTVTKDDSFTVTAEWNKRSYTNFKCTGATTGNGSTTSNTVELSGSYPVGTYANPVYYTVTLTKNVSFDLDGDGNADDLTVPVTLSVTIQYWDENNRCPGVYEKDKKTPKSAWKDNHQYLEHSGIDIDVEGTAVGTAITKGKLAIEKIVTVTDGSTDSSEFTFTVKNSEGKYVTFSGYAATGNSDTLTDSCYITVAAGEKVVLTDLVDGVYTITEIQKDGYIITNADGEVTNNYTFDYTVQDKDDDSIPIATFTNKKLTNEAGISIKKIASGLSDDSTYPNPTVSIYAVDDSGSMTDEAVWTGQLTANGDVLYLTTTLPAGKYIIAESGYEVEGYNCVTTLTGAASVEGLIFSVESGTRYDLVVNNQYSERPKTTTITLVKKVTGNMGDRNKEFNFTVSVKDALGTAYTDFAINDENKTEVNLSHGETAVIGNVPVGGKISIIEENDGYETTYTVTDSSNEVTSTGKGTTITDEIINAGDVITFTNHKEAAIDTGVLLDSLPYVLILVIVIAGVVIMIIRKRRSYDED